MKAKYYKDGNNLVATIGKLDLPEITEEEYNAEMEKAKVRIAEQLAEAIKNAPPTEAERLEVVEMAILELAEVLANG